MIKLISFFHQLTDDINGNCLSIHGTIHWIGVGVVAAKALKKMVCREDPKMATEKWVNSPGFTLIP